MARAPDKRIEQAKALYLKGRKLADIARELDLPEGTVRSWKNRYKWDAGSNATLQKKKCNVAKGKSRKAKVVADEVDEVLQNSELTDKQRLFCLYYVRCFNAAKAYRRAYECDEYTARVNGSRMLTFANIRTEMERLKRNRLNRELLDEHDIFQKYMDIAFADITDYVEFGNKDINVTDPNSGKEEKITISYVNIKNSDEVDGTLLSEVSKGRDGVKVRLADRMKAMQWLSDHMDLATEEQKARIDVLKTKVQSEESGGAVVDDWISAVTGESHE